ncbi:MAG: GNAT family N-acetyltransferase [Bradyrhizobium sp.]|nr:GNAT family N-acetyltransferase [Bradyrhizobium sp.]
MNIEIEEFPHLNYSPGFALAAEGFARLAAEHPDATEASLHFLQKTITARIDDKVVGVIVWEKTEYNRQAWIVLGYVTPAYQRRGVYNALYRRLVEIARRENLRSVAGGVAYGNRSMRAVAERQSRAPVAIIYQEIL